MFTKKIQTEVEISSLIASRWSGRAYDKDKSLTREQLLALAEAARWAPSCYGDQPWRFIFFDCGQNKPAWDQALSTLAEGNKAWAKDAPLLILSCADTIMSKNGQANRWGQYDTGAAAENLCLQAAVMGLMAHQMGGFDSDLCRELFAVPEQFVPMAMISIGYQLDENMISETMKEREYSERKRNVLDDNFFVGRWGAGIKQAPFSR